MSYLLPIAPLESENKSGIRTIRVTRKNDVSTFPESYEGIAQAAIAFESGKDWIVWAATYSTAGFSTRSEDSQEGRGSSQELPFIIPRHTQELTSMLKKAVKDEFIVLIEDYNGQRYLFGTKDKPVLFAFELQTGTGGDRNQYACRFFSASPENYLIYPYVFGEGDTDFSSCPPVVIRRGSSEGPVLAVAPAGGTVVINSPYSFGYQLVIS